MTLVTRIQDLFAGLTARLGFFAPLLARVCLGVSFISTGWAKLHNLEQITGFFTELHIPAPAIQATFISGLEFFGGILILAGLMTRLASALLACTMVVAILTAKLPDIHEISDLTTTLEFAYLALFVWLVIAGAGAISLDRLIVTAMRKREDVSA